MSDKVLVTGGCGYIGSHIVNLLLKNNFEVVIVDNLSTGYKQAAQEATLLVGDLGDTQFMSNVFRDHEFSGVFHFAGSIIVPESVEKPLMYYSNNTVNSMNLIRSCVENNINHFVFSSTAAVYGILEAGRAKEDSPLKPINPYGQSKLMTEHMLKDTSFAHSDFHYTALRYFNVSGASPEGKIGQAFPGATHLIKVNCEAATGKREKTYIFGDDFNTIDGSGVRDYIHVSDLAQAHLDAYEFMKNKKESNVFNCGYGSGFSVKQVVKAVKEVTGVDYPVETVERRAGDPDELVADSTKLQNIVGWKPKYNDLSFIIKSAYEWEGSEILKSWTNNG